MKITFIKKINPETLALFFRQFCTLIKVGVPIVKAIEILSEQTEDSEFEKILIYILNDLSRKGIRLYKAFQKHSTAFNPIHICMIKAGEESGTLSEVLDQLATYEEKELYFQRRVKASLTYPLMIALVSFAIIFVLIRFVLPTIIATVSGLPEQKLPLPTKIVFNIAKIAQNPFIFLFVILFIAVFAFLFINYIKTPFGKTKWDAFKLKFPLLGSLLLKVFTIRFCITLNALYGSGIPVLNCLQFAARAGNNDYIYEKIENRIIKKIKEGEKIHQTFKEAKIFPPMIVNMFEAGEESGQIEKMLKKISQMYELDVELSLSQLTNLLEPILIIILGIAVCTIILAALMPIYQITKGF